MHTSLHGKVFLNYQSHWLHIHQTNRKGGARQHSWTTLTLNSWDPSLSPHSTTRWEETMQCSCYVIADRPKCNVIIEMIVNTDA